jgi:hypothetical protein
LPELQALADEYRDRGVELVTVVLGGNPIMAKRVAARLGVTAPVLVADRKLQRDFKVNAVPWTVVVNRDGKPVSAVRGARGKEDFKKLLKKVL